MNELIKEIKSHLSKIYSDNEVNNLSKIICCEMLGITTLDYYTRKDIVLSEKEHQMLKNILDRLMSHEPIQYIQGKARFCGHDFYVAPGVLIPRPETEELVELIAQAATPSSKILDMGTGSGCIAISLAAMLKDAQVDAWDLSDKALKIAIRNSMDLNVQVNFQKQDIFSYVPSGEENYDIIVSNPPYVLEREKQGMDANVLDWEPAEALFVPDGDPLLYYKKIATLAKDMLVKGGRLFFEINREMGDEMRMMLVGKGFHEIEVLQDISKNDRIVTAKR